MIEVQLQPHEINHPAFLKPGEDPILRHWWGKMGSFWDMDFIEYASVEQMDTLQNAVEELFPIWEKEMGRFTHLITGIQVCGSYAYGTQRWWSDFDIQLVCATYENQRELEELFREHHNLIKNTVRKLGQRLKHSIEIHYSVHNNIEQGVEVYSLYERKLYNREEGVRRADNFRRRFKSNIDNRYKPPKEKGKYEIKLRSKPFCDSDFWKEDGTIKPIRLFPVIEKGGICQ